jgi:hypothetical protein
MPPTPPPLGPTNQDTDLPHALQRIEVLLSQLIDTHRHLVEIAARIADVLGDRKRDDK